MKYRNESYMLEIISVQDQNRTLRTCDEKSNNTLIVTTNGTFGRETQSSLVEQPGRNGAQLNGGELTYGRQTVMTLVTNVCCCHDKDDDCDDDGCNDF